MAKAEKTNQVDEINLDDLGVTEEKTDQAPEGEKTEKKEKKEKEPKAPTIPEGHVTAEMLAKEFEMVGRDLRVFLRSLYKDHPKGGRWHWAPDSEELKKIRAALAERKTKSAERAAEAERKKNEPKEKKTGKDKETAKKVPDPVDDELEGIEL